ncbi:hypothetical protein CN604_24720 [Bacillus wiedmannii]|uniref:hypothetical protein n=1 Tax=Bacillus wiedmannii TaxID=1890302 RepID=UPI000BF0D87E|nr:hypothetical protein [Bacillus wiedmannii]PEL95783.1 hypothetical protein CN604_24720 [Bacillus wiedmannii]
MKYCVELPNGKSVELASGTNELKTYCHVEGCETETTATRDVFCEEHRKTHAFNLTTLKGVKRGDAK